MGPLCIADLCWYEVFNVDPLVGWDADHNGQPEDSRSGVGRVGRCRRRLLGVLDGGSHRGRLGKRTLIDGPDRVPH